MTTFGSVTTCYGPGYIMTTNYVTRLIDGRQEINRSIASLPHYHHAITPETATSTHYFDTSSRTHRHDDVDFDEAYITFDTGIRQQDVEAAEATEIHLEQFGEPPVGPMVKIDVASVWARWRIQRAIEHEFAPAGDAPVRDPAQ